MGHINQQTGNFNAYYDSHNKTNTGVPENIERKSSLDLGHTKCFLEKVATAETRQISN